eukprot:15456013-Alexandrium_andersonii.AAC.1
MALERDLGQIWLGDALSAALAAGGGVGDGSVAQNMPGAEGAWLGESAEAAGRASAAGGGAPMGVMV